MLYLSEQGVIACAIIMLLFFLGMGNVNKKRSTDIETIYDVSINDIDGDAFDWDLYRGKLLLVVNTASYCGFTKQYSGLESLYQRYKDKGFVVIAVPSNDFFNQEPGTNEDVKRFCQTKYSTTFPLLEKVHVKGKEIHPLFEFITYSNPDLNVVIRWNFTKCLISRDGKVIQYYSSITDPLDSSIVDEIEKKLD